MAKPREKNFEDNGEHSKQPKKIMCTGGKQLCYIKWILKIVAIENKSIKLKLESYMQILTIAVFQL